jgi:FkbM family methyltransferase
MEKFNLPKLEQKIYDKLKNFIVIGAFDGESHDNFFDKIKQKSNKKDNKIIFVEPIKRFYDNLTQNVLSINDVEVICENVGISDKNEDVTMATVNPNVLYKYPSYIEGCTCVVENGTPINTFIQQVDDGDLIYEKLSCITFNDLLFKHNFLDVDFLQIDTEGYDERIVKSINFDSFNIKFIKFEKFYLTEGFIDEFTSKISHLDYVTYSDEMNHYFLKKTLLNEISNELSSDKFYNIEEQRLWNDEQMWVMDGHEWSKSFGTTENLWNKYIFDSIKEFRGKKILEIAPGFGRMTQFLSILANELIVVDLNPLCIEKTKQKLGNHVLAYFINDGKSLLKIRNNSQDLVFSYDSFVHMHANVTEEYIKEIYRVLKPGGCGYIHHSWIYGGTENSVNNIAGRANMSPEQFKQLVELYGMEIISQNAISFESVGLWNGNDCISFFRKPL